VIPAIDNLTFWDMIALTVFPGRCFGRVYRLQFTLVYFTVSPAPVGVAEADATPALRRALYRLVILLMGAAE